MRRPPVRVGILHDYPRPDGGASFEWAVRGVDEVDAAGRLPCELVFVHEPAHEGGVEGVTAGFTRLAERGVTAVLGPALTPGAVATTPLAEGAGIPCINYAGSDEARGAHMF